MKRIPAMLLSLALSLALLAACAVGTGSLGGEAGKRPDEGVRTGLSLLTTASGSDAGEKNGKVETDVLAAAVLVGEDGRIISTRLDILQANIEFTAEGALATDVNAGLPTKAELGDGYGMKKASGIGREWYEQALAFEAWTAGKTAGELMKGADETGAPIDADLVAGCTIHVGDFIKTVLRAMEGAQPLGAQAGDKLGLAITGSASGSKDASAGGSGSAALEVLVSAVSTDENGVVTSQITDGVQPAVAFDASGRVTPPEGEFASKLALGGDYGMKKASGIGREWNEQAAAFGAGLVGKNARQVAAVVEDGKTVDADILAGCTIYAGGLVEGALKAMENAR